MANKKLLGMAINDIGFDIVELHIGNRKREVRRCARFAFPPDKPRESSREIGKSLLEFLREKHFSAHLAAVAVPAGWLLAKPKGLPPASEDAAVDILKLEAESDFTIDVNELAIDYTGSPAKDRPSQVFMVGMLKKKIKWIADILDAAGLKCVSISPASMLASAFYDGANTDQETSLELLLGPHEAELLVRSGQGIQLLKQIPSPTATNKNGGEDAEKDRGINETAVGEIKRLTSLITAGEYSGALWIWNGSGLVENSASQLANMLNAPLKGVGNLASLGISMRSDCAWEAEPIAPSAAALAAVESGRIDVNFLNPRLAEKPEATNLKKLAYVAGGAFVLIAICAALMLNTISLSQRVNHLSSRLKRISDEVAEAEYFVNTANYASRWHATDPLFLEFLRELTLLFPEEGKVWVNRLNINSDMHVVLTARARDEDSILDLLERINSSASFANLKTQYMRESGSTAREYSFEISFDFNRTRIDN